MSNLVSVRNTLEPASLVDCFEAYPPEGFYFLRGAAAPAFAAPFNLLTTADEKLLGKLSRLPGYQWWSSKLNIKTAFVGTTVSEYALLPLQTTPAELANQVRQQLGNRYTLCIIKDIPWNSPLLSQEDNEYANKLVEACNKDHYLVIDGQALSFVPIDFPDIEAYLQRLKKSSRRYIKRRLRNQDDIQVIEQYTGPDFNDETRIDQYYSLYKAVYEQSEIHFDILTREFFSAVLKDETSKGIVFEYRHQETGMLLGWNLCYVENNKLVDKYIGLSYPAARDVSLYFVSWIYNLEYCLKNGYSHYIAGWTDPEVKAMLGASFTGTRHAVYIRNPLLRKLLGLFKNRISPDSQWIEGNTSE